MTKLTITGRAETILGILQKLEMPIGTSTKDLQLRLTQLILNTIPLLNLQLELLTRELAGRRKKLNLSPLPARTVLRRALVVCVATSSMPRAVIQGTVLNARACMETSALR